MSPYVAAQPGTYMLDFYPEEEGSNEFVSREPVVAWLIEDDDCQAIPITMQPIVQGPWHVLFPDGRVMVPGDFEEHETFDKWLERRRKDHAAGRR